MKNLTTIIGSAAALVLATSCCWLPWLALAFGGAAGLSSLTAGLGKWSGLFMTLGIALAAWSGWQLWQKRKTAPSAGNIVLKSRLTCPDCGFQKTENMPTDACQFFYKCENCHSLLKPKPGDCCVFCSYGDVKCPPVQAGHNCC